MTLYLQVSGGVILSVILILAIKSHCNEIATVLAVFVCCIAILAAMTYLQPVLAFLQTLEHLGGLDSSMVKTLLKVTGIGILTEVARLICKDASNESLGKSMQLLGGAVILYLSIPLFTALLELAQRILGAL